MQTIGKNTADAMELAGQLKARVGDYYKAARVLDFCQYERAEAQLDLTVASALVALAQENEQLHEENDILMGQIERLRQENALLLRSNAHLTDGKSVLMGVE